ncbi:single-stranded DNA-binding protein [Nocardiopsis sp. CT-R113]|uniref:Single-stranded DNA-binding protein n=1 Tax=Nocardiopsis codii TaxID=3065942 RepID=A0ABU7KEV1_9ACTN|nr:single-stranded DNA-binding protein [Nocardiopsis sp. CT-R113]MEE2040122.1 single-stranded DNA-binding protein [Nocardiopsis sp. CT-R113]
MTLPAINGAFRLIDAPELTFANSGTPILKVRLAANSRRLNKDTNEWEDADKVFLNGVMFGDRAEAIAEANLSKGQEVYVAGRLKTSEWETKEGEKRSAPELLIDTVAPTIRPPRRDGNQQGGQQGGGYGRNGGRQTGQRTQADDPWGGGQQGGGFGGGPANGEPPF